MTDQQIRREAIRGFIGTVDDLEALIHRLRELVEPSSFSPAEMALFQAVLSGLYRSALEIMRLTILVKDEAARGDFPP